MKMRRVQLASDGQRCVSPFQSSTVDYSFGINVETRKAKSTLSLGANVQATSRSLPQLTCSTLLIDSAHC